jgi:predicted GIY-YIG superfamily endonuclease
MKSGYLYIITNEAFPGWVKVGTTTNLTTRLHTYQTGDPFRRYKVVYSVYHPEFREAEKKINEVMKHFALEIKGEWYRIDLEMAKSRLEEQLDDYNNSNATLKIS